jgi:hypothetical protein
MCKVSCDHACLPPVPFRSLQVLLLLATQWPVRAPVKLLGRGGGALWRPCNFTPIHSLTGLVGQPFASCLGDQRFSSWGCIHTHNGTLFLLKHCLARSTLITKLLETLSLWYKRLPKRTQKILILYVIKCENVSCRKNIMYIFIFWKSQLLWHWLTARVLEVQRADGR